MHKRNIISKKSNNTENYERLPAKIELPLSEDMPITYDLRLAVPIIAALSYEEIKDDVWNWMIENYTQLVCQKKVVGNIPYNYFRIFNAYNPFLDRRHEFHFRFFWKNSKKTLEHLLKKISGGCYVHIKLDRYYLRGLDGYNSQHIMHTECVYGYNIKKEELYLFGFANFTDSSLKKTTINFSDFLMAFESFIEKERFYTLTTDKINKIQKYEINETKMIAGLENYINSNLPIEKIFENNRKKETVFSWDFPVNCVVGISSINEMSKAVLSNNYLNQKTKVKTIMQVLLEFQVIMLKRFDYFWGKGKIDKTLLDSYSKIINGFESLKFMYLKFVVTNNYSNMDSFVLQLQHLNEATNPLISELLNKIEPERNKKNLTRKLLGMLKKSCNMIKISCISFFVLLKELSFFVYSIIREIYSFVFDN